MYLYRNKKSRFFQAEIWVEGRQYRRSTGCTSRREAGEAARRIEAELKAQAGIEKAVADSLLLKDVATRYMDLIGDHHAGADNTDRLVRLVLSHPKFHPNKLITDVTHDDVLELRAWRRSHQTGPADKRRPISPLTVNDTIEQVKKLFTYCKNSGVKFEHEPKWKDLWLEEPLPRPRELAPAETTRLDTALAGSRADYQPLLEFARYGKRRTELITLKWDNVNWDAGLIEQKGKKGRIVKTDITPEIRAILWPLYVGREENCGVPEAADFVFTFTAVRTIDKVIKGKRYRFVKGKRYPVTRYGLRRVWDSLRAEAKLTGASRFRFHDHRHDLATKVLRNTGNLKLVAALLDHTDTVTVSRTYAHVTREDTAEALMAFTDWRAGGARRDKNPRTRPRTRKLKAV